MDQCLAKTKSGSRCRRPAAQGCAGYCKPHFDDLPPGTAEAAARRAKAKNMIRKVGKAIGTGIGAVEVLKDIWDIVGPFLSLRERHHLEVLSDDGAPTQLRVKSLNSLVRSLGKTSMGTDSRSRSRRYDG